MPEWWLVLNSVCWNDALFCAREKGSEARGGLTLWSAPAVIQVLMKREQKRAVGRAL